MGIGRSPRKAACFTLGIEFPYHAYHLTYELDYVLQTIRGFKPDVIVNFAAQGEGANSWGMDNWRFYETNCVGLVKLISHFQETRFIQIGSSEVYGSVDKPVSESSHLVPTSPYSVSKAAFDLHLVAMHKVCKFPMNIIRPSNCYAPGQQLHRIIPKALISGVAGRKIPLHGGGVARKSYLHATDLSNAILKVISGPVGEIYNVGPDNPTPIREVVERCAKALGMEFEDLCELAPERTGQDSTYWLDSSKIKALGWKQEIGWRQGLADMVQWVKRYPELEAMNTNFVMRA
jgi:dTDP-glucose 4,6-dehydratase